MLIRFKQGEVQKTIHRVASFATRAPDPFSYLLIRAKAADAGGTIIAANNGQNQCWAPVDAVCEEGGEVLVRADMLMALLDRLPDVELVMKTGKTVTVHCGKDSYRLSSIFDLSGYPDVKQTPPESFVFPAEKFMTLLDTVRHAAAVDDVRYYLNGIRMRKVDGNVEATACNGHRLAQVFGAAPVADLAMEEVILPIGAIHKALPILSREGDLKLFFGVNLYFIEDSRGMRLSGLVIDGKYPDTAQVIGTTPVSFMADVGVLQAGIERACAVQACEGPGGWNGIRWVRLTHLGAKLRLSHEGKSSGMEETLAVNPIRKDGVATVNAEYLLDALGTLKGEARFHFPERGDQPLKIEQPDRTMVIQQMRI